MHELTSSSVAELASVTSDRTMSCVAVTQELLTHAYAVDRQLHCFIGIDGDLALARASALDRRERADPAPLLGVPFGYKDIFARHGTAPSAGARSVSIRLRATETPALRKLEDAGAISLGRLNLDPFGYSATGINEDFGNVRNPWNPACIAGGSSGGAAAAVAAGALPFAIGTDTGGSIRIPASYCGVVGFKPTLGRVSKRGAVPVSYSQDTVGIIARSAEDVAAVLDVVAGYDELDAGSIQAPHPRVQRRSVDRPFAGIRVGVDLTYLAAMTTGIVMQTIEDTLATLVELGASRVAVDLGPLRRYDVSASVLTWAEIGAVHRATFTDHPEQYPGAIRARLPAALGTRGSDHVNALRFQGRALREFLADVLARVDLVLTAATARPAVQLEPVATSDAAALEVSLEALCLNRPFSHLGLPAITFPAGFTTEGLPIGVQLVARPWADGQLLSLVAAYQELTDWHRRSPPLLHNTAESDEPRESP